MAIRRRLTINLADILGRNLPDEPIVISLAAPDRVIPDPGPPSVPGRLLPDDPVTVYTDADSVAIADLYATTDLIRRNPYIVTIPDYDRIELVMPDNDAALYDLLNTPSSPLPARQLPDPTGVADGTTIAALANAWVGDVRFYYAQPTAPAAPSAGVLALWTDTGSGQLKYYDHATSAWVAADRIQPGTVGTAELADGSVTAPKMAANAVLTASVADDAITTGKLAPGAVQAAKIASDAVGTSALSDGSVTHVKLAANSVESDNIAADQIGGREIAARGLDSPTLFGDQVITTRSIADNAVTARQIAAGTITDQEIAANAVTTQELADGSVTAPKLAANAVLTGKVASGAITTDKLAPGAVQAVSVGTDAVGTAAIQDAAVTARKIADGVISGSGSGTSDHIAAGSITTQDLADGSVTDVKLATGAVATGKIVAGAVTGDKLAADAVTRQAIADSAVGTDQLAANAVATGKVADNAITADKLADNAVDTAAIQDMAVTAPKLAAGIITGGTGGHIAAGGITTQELADGAVTNPKLAAGAVGPTQLASDSVTRAKLADDAVGPDQLAANAVTQAKIAAGAVGSREIAANAVNASEIANAAVGTTNLADGSVTRPKLADGAVGELQLGADAVTTSRIEDGAVTQAKLAPGVSTGGGGVTIGGSPTGNNPVKTNAAATGLVEGLIDSDEIDADTQMKKDAWQHAIGLNMMEATGELVSRFTVTQGVIGTNERGFSRDATQAGGSINPASAEIGGNTFTPIYVSQSQSSGTIFLFAHGTLPADYTDWLIYANGHHLGDARINLNQQNSDFPVGLRTYTEWRWTARSLDVMWNEGVGSQIVIEIRKPITDIIDRDEIKSYALVGGPSIATADLADNLITQSKLAGNAVQNHNLANNSVTQDKIAPASVSTAKLNDDVITPAKLDADTAAKQRALRDRIGVYGQSVVMAFANYDDAPAGSANASGSVGIDTGDIADYQYLHVKGKGAAGAAADVWIETSAIPTSGTNNLLSSITINSVSGSVRYNASTNVIWVDATGQAPRILYASFDNYPPLPQGLSAGSVGTTELADNAVTRVKIADNAVGADQIDDTLLTDIRNRSSIRVVKTYTSYANTPNGNTVTLPADYRDADYLYMVYPFPTYQFNRYVSIRSMPTSGTHNDIGRFVIAPGTSNNLRWNATNRQLTVPGGRIATVELITLAGTAGGMGVGGQGGAGIIQTTFVQLWGRYSSAPAASTLAGAEWGGTGWTATPSGWQSNPIVTGTDPLYIALTTATYQPGTGLWTLGAWSITAVDSFNIQYTNSANPAADPALATTSTAAASSRYFRTRESGGAWGVWIPIYEPEAWTEIAHWDFAGITSSNRTGIAKTFPAPIFPKFLGFAVQMLDSFGSIVYNAVDVIRVNTWYRPESETTTFPAGSNYLLKSNSASGLSVVSTHQTTDTFTDGFREQWQGKLGIRGANDLFSGMYLYQVSHVGVAGELKVYAI